MRDRAPAARGARARCTVGACPRRLRPGPRSRDTPGLRDRRPAAPPRGDGRALRLRARRPSTPSRQAPRGSSAPGRGGTARRAVERAEARRPPTATAQALRGVAAAVGGSAASGEGPAFFVESRAPSSTGPTCGTSGWRRCSWTGRAPSSCYSRRDDGAARSRSAERPTARSRARARGEAQKRGGYASATACSAAASPTCRRCRPTDRPTTKAAALTCRALDTPRGDHFVRLDTGDVVRRAQRSKPRATARPSTAAQDAPSTRSPSARAERRRRGGLPPARADTGSTTYRGAVPGAHGRTPATALGRASWAGRPARGRQVLAWRRRRCARDPRGRAAVNERDQGAWPRRGTTRSAR